MATKTERFWYIDNSTKRPRMGIVEKATNATTKDGYTSQFKSISAAKDITIYAISISLSFFFCSFSKSSLVNVKGTYPK